MDMMCRELELEDSLNVNSCWFCCVFCVHLFHWCYKTTKIKTLKKYVKVNTVLGKPLSQGVEYRFDWNSLIEILFKLVNWKFQWNTCLLAKQTKLHMYSLLYGRVEWRIYMELGLFSRPEKCLKYKKWKYWHVKITWIKQSAVYNTLYLLLYLPSYIFPLLWGF